MPGEELPPQSRRIAFAAAGGGFGGALLAIIVAKLLSDPCCCGRPVADVSAAPTVPTVASVLESRVESGAG